MVTFTPGAQQSNTAATAGGTAAIATVAPGGECCGRSVWQHAAAQALLVHQQAQWEAARCLSANTVLRAMALASALEQITAVRNIIAVDERNLEQARLSTNSRKTTHVGADCQQPACRRPGAAGALVALSQQRSMRWQR